MDQCKAGRVCHRYLGTSANQSSSLSCRSWPRLEESSLIGSTPRHLRQVSHKRCFQGGYFVLNHVHACLHIRTFSWLAWVLCRFTLSRAWEGMGILDYALSERDGWGSLALSDPSSFSRIVHSQT